MNIPATIPLYFYGLAVAWMFAVDSAANKRASAEQSAPPVAVQHIPEDCEECYFIRHCRNQTDAPCGACDYCAWCAKLDFSAVSNELEVVEENN